MHSLGPFDEWYVDPTGLANGLSDELSNVTPSKERQFLKSASQLTDPPTDQALYLGLSVACFVGAQNQAATGAMARRCRPPTASGLGATSGSIPRAAWPRRP